ncbi:MAG: HigA family addiction module antidote protein [Candidatus Riflebacteria bacterium]|nr:HigA family addiction module antidote protein [Candidatus Riflebacteria bacterium]
MSYKAPIPIHPGVTLKEILETENMTQAQLASRTGMHNVTVSNILTAKDPISPDTAIKLSMVLGISEGFWNNLQKNYEETKARIALEKEIGKELETFKHFTCFPELVKHEYLNNASSTEERAKNLLNFLGLASFKLLGSNYQVAFRKTTTNSLSKENLIAWLRCGEIEATKINTKPFDKAKLKASLKEIRSLNLLGASEYSVKLIELLAECGVAIAFVPYLKNTFVNGATRWLSPNKVLIQLTPRNKYEDILWFTLFHEICHVLNHGKKEGYISFWDDNYLKEDIIQLEREANYFAGEVLIPQKEWSQFIASKTTGDAILQFSKKIGVKSGIVAGRLGKETGEWSRVSKYRKKIKVRKSSRLAFL